MSAPSTPPASRSAKPDTTKYRLPGHTLRPEGDSRGSIAIGVGLGLAVVVGGGLAFRWFARDDTPEAPSASASASPPRCARVGGEPVVIGEAAANGVDAGDDDDFTPDAPTLGRAIAFDGGFAVGALVEQGGATNASIVTLDDQDHGAIVTLGRSRGDLEPPVVAPVGAAVLVASLEPNAGGISTRVGRVTGNKLEWITEIDRKKGDAIDADLAVSGERAAIVWDDLDSESSRLFVETFAAASEGRPSEKVLVSPEKTDASSPRLIAKEGGFYLLYVARGAEIGHADDDYPDEARKADEKRKTAPKPSADAGANDDIDESRGERMFASWIEVLPLDTNGKPAGSAIKLTRPSGRVSGYDVASGKDGFDVVWRDEDAPSGGAGGSAQIVHVSASGPGNVESLAEPSHPSESGEANPIPAGAPALFAGWITISEETGRTMIGRIGDDGRLTEPLAIEPTLGSGSLVAAHGEHLLVATPRGRSMSLALYGCAPKSLK